MVSPRRRLDLGDRCGLSEVGPPKEAPTTTPRRPLLGSADLGRHGSTATCPRGFYKTGAAIVGMGLRRIRAAKITSPPALLVSRSWDDLSYGNRPEAERRMSTRRSRPIRPGRAYPRRSWGYHLREQFRLPSNERAAVRVASSPCAGTPASNFFRPSPRPLRRPQLPDPQGYEGTGEARRANTPERFFSRPPFCHLL
jgi:hypothetical protein